MASSKIRSKASKHPQKQDKTISLGMSSKILKEMLIQQKEILEEFKEPNATTGAFVFAEAEESKRQAKVAEEEDIDDSGGFSETQSQLSNYEAEIDEDDERSLEAFLSKVDEFLNKYTAGKLPKAFKNIPSTQMWEDVLYFTEPEKCLPNAMYQAT